MIFYGLLHLEPREYSAHNVKMRSFEDQTILYLKNAVTLSESLARHGLSFKLLTNAEPELSNTAKQLGMKIEILQIKFTTQVPAGFKFFSAHFKLDALKFIADAAEEYAALCDIDMICINELPTSLKNIISRRIPLFYDISDQVISAYGHHVIIDDLTNLSGSPAQGRWAGGEYISGPPQFFMKLHRTVQEVWPRYLLYSENLHHIGDEAVVSAALDIMVKNGTVICDAGTLGVVGRFWSGNIKHHQRPLAHYRKTFLFHLPADKRLLADLDHRDIGRFWEIYRLYIKKKRFANSLKKLFSNVISLRARHG